MKKLTMISVLLALFSCANSKKSMDEKTPAVSPQILLNDIWVATQILDVPYTPNMRKTPQLEFQLSENRVSGNDGCNSFSGSTKTLDDKNLVFGMIAATKMACEDMSISQSFHTAIRETTQYKIEKGHLFLMNNEGVTLMVLKKVD